VNKHIKKVKLDARGFTLIEVIASLVLLGIIAVMAGMGIVQITKQYVFAQKAGETAQVAQVAMARMVKELAMIRSGSGAPTTVTIISPISPTTNRTSVISWAGGSNPITISVNAAAAQTLIENVTGLTLRYYNRYDGTVTNGGETTTYNQFTTVMIGVSFAVTGADGISSIFSGRAYVRN
jgi:prepilin-type N-terminal cleavage/methylation domain-containing protein